MIIRMPYNRASEEFDCPVFAVQNYVDILQNRELSYAVFTSTPIEEVVPKHGDIMEFHEFRLTFRVFRDKPFIMVRCL